MVFGQAREERPIISAGDLVYFDAKAVMANGADMVAVAQRQ